MENYDKHGYDFDKWVFNTPLPQNPIFGGPPPISPHAKRPNKFWF